MIDNSLLGNSTSLLEVWAIVLAVVVLFSWIMVVFPKPFVGLRPVLFAVVSVPVITVLVLFIVRGFTPIEKPLVHWVFDRESSTALRFGMILDPVAWIASFSFAAALFGTTLRNRPNIRMVSAVTSSWVGLCWVASSKTIWTALLGVAIQAISHILPLFPSSEDERPDGKLWMADGRWMATTKRTWIAIILASAGATALVTLGVHVDFSPEQTWSKLDENFSAFVAGGLFLSGLILLLSPALSVRAIQDDISASGLPSGEERLFSFEGSIGWSAVIILYRMQDCLKGTHWPLVISIASAGVALLSIPSLVFHERRRNAAIQWMTALPAFIAIVLPLLPPEEAFIFVSSAFPIAAGLMVVFESPKSKVGVWFSGFFVLGACGLMGWSSSAGLAKFYSGVEESPALQGTVALLWLLYCAIGWRIALRGKTDEKDPSIVSTSIVAGLLVILAFGPAISGRWSGGSIPEAPDWINGAKAWPWLEKFGEAPVEMKWVGFLMSQAIWFVGLILGTFVASSSPLFPFSERGGRGKEVTSGLFGAHWLWKNTVGGLEIVGRFWAEKVSSPLWESILPGAVQGIIRGFSKMGEFAEKAVDPITSSAYGSAVRAPAKFVRWIHGGNARLYGWFALIWILIFSLYLTRP